MGPLRLVNPLLADQMGWLYPLALAGVVAWLWRRRVRLPLSPDDSAVLLWLGWVLTYSLVLSYAGGIFHSYYLAATAPPVCALAAVGVVRLWEWFRAGGRRALALPLCLLIAAAWQSYIAHGYLTWELNTPQRGSSQPAETFIHAQNALMIASYRDCAGFCRRTVADTRDDSARLPPLVASRVVGRHPGRDIDARSLGTRQYGSQRQRKLPRSPTARRTN